MTVAARKTAAAEKAASSEESAPGAGKSRLLRLHHLRPAPGAKRPKIRVGRGESGKRGKTAGRGTKGSKARDRIPSFLEGGALPAHMRFPKMRGAKSRHRVEYQVVNLERLAEFYPDGGVVTPEDLAAKGLVRKSRPVKILGTGKATAAWQVSADAFSASAAEKIRAAGGSVTER